MRIPFLLLILLLTVTGVQLVHTHIPFQTRPIITVEPRRDFTIRTAMAMIPFRDSSVTSFGELTLLTVLRAHGRTRYSANALVLAMELNLLNEGPPQWYSLLLLGPLLYSNYGLQYPLLDDRWFVYGKLNTDYYLFYDESRITSECAIGSILKFDNVVIGADIRQPIVRGYRNDKSPYFTLTVGVQ